MPGYILAVIVAVAEAEAEVEVEVGEAVACVKDSAARNAIRMRMRAVGIENAIFVRFD